MMNGQFMPTAAFQSIMRAPNLRRYLALPNLRARVQARDPSVAELVAHFRKSNSWVFGGGSGGGGLNLGGLLPGLGGPSKAGFANLLTTGPYTVWWAGSSGEANVTETATTVSVQTPWLSFKEPDGTRFDIPAGTQFFISPRAAANATIALYQAFTVHRDSSKQYVRESFSLPGARFADAADANKIPRLPFNISVGPNEFLNFEILSATAVATAQAGALAYIHGVLSPN